MKKTTVIFVRHAQSLHPYSDDRTRPLTDEGMTDRRIVLDTLKDRQIDAFLSSPYQRSIDTIITTADLFGMKIKTDERFRERLSGTDASGMLERRWADFSFAEKGGENLESVQKRNIEALKDVLNLYKGRTVVIGTHGTALSCILNYYDRSFGINDFLRIVSWMPYIVELTFDGESLLEKKELAHMEKAYQKIDFSVITACGECCTGCAKKASGQCPGCIEADGVVPEWAGSGRCRIHKCVREHGVQFCGLCRKFPCERIPDLIPWNPDIISHLTYLKDEYKRQTIPKRVYCGGRFDFDYPDEGYEQKAAEDYRAILLKDVGLLLRKSDSVRVSENLEYIGPFYFETDGMLDRDIVETEMTQIQNCTLAVFLIDEHPCPGTIAEMIYAASLQKEMSIFYVQDREETESVLLSPHWYPLILCQKINHINIQITPCEDFSEAKNKILEYLYTQLK